MKSRALHSKDKLVAALLSSWERHQCPSNTLLMSVHTSYLLIGIAASHRCWCCYLRKKVLLLAHGSSSLSPRSLNCWTTRGNHKRLWQSTRQVSSNTGGKEPGMRAELGFGWCEYSWRKPRYRCCSFFVQKYFTVLALHTCCSIQGDVGVVNFVHVTSSKNCAHLPLIASGLSVLHFEHNTCIRESGERTFVLDGNGSFSLVCFLMM